MSPVPPKSSPQEPHQKGSVKRARQLLDAGVRPELVPPHRFSKNHSSPVPKVSPQNQWPLPDLRSQQPRFPVLRRPAPQRPPRPSDMASPSTYSEKSAQVSETSSTYTRRPTQSFSQLQPPPSRLVTNDGSYASPTSTVDMNPHLSIATEDLFRKSTASASSVPQPPPLWPPPKAPLQQEDPRQRIAGVVAPSSNRQARRSSVSPIAEEISDPRHTIRSFASSRVIPSSWGSGPPESEILGAYLDIDSDDDSESSLHDDGVALVRNASLGKRAKPTMRTISKTNSTSRDSAPKPQTTDTQNDSPMDAAIGAVAAGAMASQTCHAPTRLRSGSVSTSSSESVKGVDPEKPPISHQDDQMYWAAYEKEMPSLPNAALAMSDKRPDGHKPPPLNIGAVRDAEVRGSLSSMTDLVRRATKLASNLDRGRTASRLDLTDSVADFKAAFAHRPRNTGSLSNILDSFPPPGLSTPDEGRDSWPVLFGNSNLRNVEHLASKDNGSEGSGGKACRRRCCGMPRWLFILLCTLLFVIVVLAILLPVFLLVVPREKANSSQPSCSQTTPCYNGGVSVSSGAQCSCVCANGYTGSQCTIESDGNCATALVSNSSIAKNATMGSALPKLLRDSPQKFHIQLDSVTIMALFSKASISCTTENALVSFSKVRRNTHSGHTQRSAPVELLPDPRASGETGTRDGASPSVSSTEPTPVLAARAEATLHGIVYDPAGPSQTSNAAATTESSVTHTVSQTNATATSTSEASGPTATGVSELVVEFSQVAVLFMLEKTGSLNIAMASESQIQSYLIDSYTNSPHVTLGHLELPYSYSLDFANKTITLPGGAVAGG